MERSEKDEFIQKIVGLTYKMRMLRMKIEAYQKEKEEQKPIHAVFRATEAKTPEDYFEFNLDYPRSNKMLLE